jgi:acetyl esterase/lipase
MLLKSSTTYTLSIFVLLQLLLSTSRSADYEPLIEQGIEYANPDGQHLKLDIARPATIEGTAAEGTFPAVVCIHGGGFRAGDLTEFAATCEMLARKGYVAVTIDYRLSPKYPFPAAVEDSKAAVRWLRANAEKYHVNPQRIGVTGASAGGTLALYLGVTGDKKEYEGDGGNSDESSAVQCVVSFFGASDFTKSYGKSADAAEVLPLYLGGNLEVARDRHIEASPLTWVSKKSAPTLCIHGTKDEYVDQEQSKLMVDRLKAVGVEAKLMVLPGAGHGFEGADYEKADAAMVRFFDSHLKK